jgi:hypothetical protein
VSSALVLYACAGGVLKLPAARSVLADREDGGNLLANPPRTVWERSALTPDELAAWAFLVAATGEAMLAVLPQLEGGCINYWEAGNWALNEAAAPAGPKRAPEHRKMHLHLLGRSRFSTNPDYAWGESPHFPDYAEKDTWSADKARFTAAECTAIVTRADEILRDKFKMSARDGFGACPSCGYPKANAHRHGCEN